MDPVDDMNWQPERLVKRNKGGRRW